MLPEEMIREIEIKCIKIEGRMGFLEEQLAKIIANGTSWQSSSQFVLNELKRINYVLVSLEAKIQCVRHEEKMRQFEKRLNFLTQLVVGVIIGGIVLGLWVKVF